MRTVMLRKIKGGHQLWFPRDAARAKIIVMHAAMANQSHATDFRGSGVPSIELKGSRLTFDMRGGRQLAKPDVARPIDGRVRAWLRSAHAFRCMPTGDDVLRGRQ